MLQTKVEAFWQSLATIEMEWEAEMFRSFVSPTGLDLNVLPSPALPKLIQPPLVKEGRAG